MDDRLYYRRKGMRSVRRPESSGLKTFLYPFFLLVLGVFALYLVFQVLSFLVSGGSDEIDIKLYVEKGNVDVILAGDEQPIDSLIASGHPLQPNDSVRTGSDTRAVIEFFGTTQLRLAPNTEVVLGEVSNNKKKQVVDVDLKRGQAWSNVLTEEETKEYNFLVSTGYMDVRAVGTIFDVKAGFPEYVRVIEGSVEADIKTIEDGNENVLDTVAVSVGQELTLTQADLRQFIERQVPKILGPMAETFMGSEWYNWNLALDENPDLVKRFDGSSEIIAVTSDGKDKDEDEDDEEDSEDDEDSKDEDDEEGSEEDEEDKEEAKVATPKITDPKNDETQSEDLIFISGVTDSKTDKIEVTWKVGDSKAEPYILQKYESGSEEWLYVASYPGGNMIEGENTYEVRAIDADGNKSEPAVVTFTFKPTKKTTTPKSSSSGSGVEIEPVDEDSSSAESKTEEEDVDIIDGEEVS